MESKPQSQITSGTPAEIIAIGELAQNVPGCLSGEVQALAAEIFRLAVSTPSRVADISVHFGPVSKNLTVSVWQGGFSNHEADFFSVVYLESPFAAAKLVTVLAELSVFVSGAWILSGGKGGAS